MELLFSFSSEPVCWLDGNTAFSRDGHPQAFVDRGAVFSVSGTYLGQFAHKLFRDRLGRVVAFPRNVWWSRVPASFRGSWTPPHVQAHTIPSCAPRETRPLELVAPSLRQSSLTWERYLLGCAAKPCGKTRR